MISRTKFNTIQGRETACEHLCVFFPQILTERMVSDILTAAHPEPDSTFRLENPRKLPTICTFKAHSHREKAEVKENFFWCLSFIPWSFLCVPWSFLHSLPFSLRVNRPVMFYSEIDWTNTRLMFNLVLNWHSPCVNSCTQKCKTLKHVTVTIKVQYCVNDEHLDGVRMGFRPSLLSRMPSPLTRDGHWSAK